MELKLLTVNRKNRLHIETFSINDWNLITFEPLKSEFVYENRIRNGLVQASCTCRALQRSKVFFPHSKDWMEIYWILAGSRQSFFFKARAGHSKRSGSPDLLRVPAKFLLWEPREFGYDSRHIDASDNSVYKCNENIFYCLEPARDFGCFELSTRIVWKW